MFAVDDFKNENFRSENDKNKALAILQNYSDSTGRMRATKDVRLQDEKYIKGYLMISAEDTPNNQSSTLARGIIVEAKSKQPDFKKVNELEKLSKSFSGFTAHYIKRVLNEYSTESLEKMYCNNQS